MCVYIYIYIYILRIDYIPSIPTPPLSYRCWSSTARTRSSPPAWLRSLASGGSTRPTARRRWRRRSRRSWQPRSSPRTRSRSRRDRSSSRGVYPGSDYVTDHRRINRDSRFEILFYIWMWDPCREERYQGHLRDRVALAKQSGRPPWGGFCDLRIYRDSWCDILVYICMWDCCREVSFQRHVRSRVALAQVVVACTLGRILNDYVTNVYTEVHDKLFSSIYMCDSCREVSCQGHLRDRVALAQAVGACTLGQILSQTYLPRFMMWYSRLYMYVRCLPWKSVFKDTCEIASRSLK